MRSNTYLIFDYDWSTVAVCHSTEALSTWLEDLEADSTVTFLSEIPTSGGSMKSRLFAETDYLILQVEVVVPQPVTVKWKVP